jgi:hypothetical protein
MFGCPERPPCCGETGSQSTIGPGTGEMAELVVSSEPPSCHALSMKKGIFASTSMPITEMARARAWCGKKRKRGMKDFVTSRRAPTPMSTLHSHRLIRNLHSAYFSSSSSGLGACKQRIDLWSATTARTLLRLLRWVLLRSDDYKYMPLQLACLPTVRYW